MIKFADKIKLNYKNMIVEPITFGTIFVPLRRAQILD